MKKFNLVAILSILIISISVVAIEFQNDIFYTIKVGEIISKNGIDFIDHFSIHNLAYTYPHWLFDLIVYKIYNIANFNGLFILTILLSFVLGLFIYFTNIKLTKKYFTSLFFTLITLLLLSCYLTLRAQIVTFSLFVLEYYFIEKLLNTDKPIKYCIFLFIDAVLIANLHCAVYPFFFVLMLPSFVEQILALFIKKGNNKVEIKKSINIKYIIVIFFVCMLSGLLTPLGVIPYTYLYKTLIGNSMGYIQEHLPLKIDAVYPYLYIILFLIIIINKKIKIRLRDLFMYIGLILLTLKSSRQQSMLYIFLNLINVYICSNYIDFKLKDLKPFFESLYKNKIVLIFILIISLIICAYYKTMDFNNNYINEKIYPVQASKYIKKNLDLNNIKLYNEYNYGSYLIYEDIPVFIDSRADLYLKEFNGITIFDELYNINKNDNYKIVFKKYNITHILIRKNSLLYNKLIKNHYNKIYSDNYFCIFENK